MNSGAIFSTDHKRRYRLWRAWTPSQLTAVFIGQNPSTANETTDDPTIRRCVAFAKSWGRGGIEMVNLFSTVSTDPKGVVLRLDPENMAVLERVAASAGLVVAAWGVLPKGWAQVGVLSMLLPKFRAKGIDLWCLGRNKDGSPKHPLYVPGNVKPQIYMNQVDHSIGGAAVRAEEEG